MRIRENAYIALACLFFSVNNSLAQFRAGELFTGGGANIASQTPGSWDIRYLSQPRLPLKAVQAGNKAIFSSFTQCDIYDFGSGTWDTYQLPVTRRAAAVISTGETAFLAGGAKGPKETQEFLSRVDIYNSESNSWSASKLSEAREVGAAGAYGNVVVFAGGTNTMGYSSTADIFSTAKRGRKHHVLSQSRDKIAVGSAGNKIVFAGGLTGDTRLPNSSNAIDIYEVHSDTWSFTTLSQSRYEMTVASVGNRVIFAGGRSTSGWDARPSNAVDIYDAIRNTWKTAMLSEAKYGMSVAVAGNKAYFAGGITEDNTLSNKVEIYDLENGTWSVATLAARRHGTAVGITGSRLMFAGGFIDDLHTPTNRIEVLNLETGLWSVEYLSKARSAVASVSHGNEVIFAGGIVDDKAKTASANIDAWRETSWVRHAAYSGDASIALQTRKKQIHDWIYNDPSNDNFIIADLWRYETQTVKLAILNEDKQPVLTKSVIPFGNTKEQIDISGLQAGRYWVLVECNGRRPVLTHVDVKSPGHTIHEASKILAMSHQRSNRS